MAQRPLRRLVTIYLPLVLYAIFTLMPFYSMLTLAFRAGGQTTGTFHYLPIPFSLEHFSVLFREDSFIPYLVNSCITSFGAIIVIIPVAILTGYSLSRFQFKGKASFMLALLATQFIPASLMIIPMYIIFAHLHLLNTQLGLLLINSAFELPLAAILMRGFISSVPVELEEAAMVDGCRRLSGIVRVVVPVIKPGLVAVGAFAFVGSWNNYLFALFLESAQNRYTIPVGLSYFLTEFNVDYGALAAGAVIAVVPVIAIFATVQRYIAGGLVSGAVKG